MTHCDCCGAATLDTGCVDEWDGDIVGETALVIDCSRDVVGDSPVAIDEETEMVSSDWEGDVGVERSRGG